MNAFIHFILAAASGAMALLTWHSNMPKIIVMRGRRQGLCEWGLGLALALLSPALLSKAIADAPADANFVLADAAIIFYAFCRWRSIRGRNSGSWSCSA